MTIEHLVTIWCDNPECFGSSASIEGESRDAVIDEARDAGWFLSPTLHLCADCRLLPSLSEALRPGGVL